jgi:SAM-dependent methyltransferase
MLSIGRRIKSTIKSRLIAGKTPEQIFSSVYKSKAWGDRGEFFSGYGSHAQATVDTYVAALKPILASKPNVVDLGCGDFNIGKHIRPFCGDYIACDVVPDLIAYNKKAFPQIDFRCLDITVDPLPAADVALVRQVLQHLNNEQIFRFISKIGIYKTVVVTEHLPAGPFRPNLDKIVGAGIRLHGIEPSGVDLAETPFSIHHQGKEILAEMAEGDSLIRVTAYQL